jgi:hypothetical protein
MRVSIASAKFESKNLKFDMNSVLAPFLSTEARKNSCELKLAKKWDDGNFCELVRSGARYRKQPPSRGILY